MTADTGTYRRANLVKELSHAGWMRSPTWQEVFLEVPRHVFLPRFFRLTRDRRRYEAVDREHPDWLDLIYSNEILVTQLDGDDQRWQEAHDDGPVEGTATSSGTQPSLMVTMLEALDVHDGNRVLEVGTGTGYNAALLCHRLGEQQMTSVEYDGPISQHAHHCLDKAGYKPALVIGDGGRGHEAGAPYDRLIATYSVPTVPAAWLTQVRPGAVMVISLHRDLGVGLMARLIATGDGTAHGRLLPDSAYFMPTRTHDQADADILVRTASKQPGEAARLSNLPGPVSDESTGWTALAGLLLPDVIRLDIFRADGAVQWLVHPDSSWAYYQASNHHVEQGGPRRLWNELEAVYDRWLRLGRPTRDRIGLTVLADGSQEVWIDTPRIQFTLER